MNMKEAVPGTRVRLRVRKTNIVGDPPVGTCGTIIDERGEETLVAVRWDGWEQGWCSPRGVGKRDCWFVYAHNLDREDTK